MEKQFNTLVKSLPCTICSGKNFFIRRTLCEAGLTEIDQFENMSRKEAIDHIIKHVQTEKKDADNFIDLLISVGVNITEGSSKKNSIDNGLITEPKEEKDE